MILHLGKVMTGDVTYFNGVEVGRERWDGVRSYRVPAKLLRKGKNVIAVRLLSEWGNGRLGDEASDPYLHSADNQVRISLKGQWKYIEPSDAPAIEYWTKMELGNDRHPQLYDLSADPSEKNNVAKQHPEVVRELSELLESVKTR